MVCKILLAYHTGMQEVFSFIPVLSFSSISWWKRYRSLSLTTNQARDMTTIMIFNWWGPIEMFMENRRMYSSCVLYEDLMKHPQKTLLQLFGVLGISKDYLDDAMKAFQVDSQRDFFGSFNVLNENAKNK